MKTLIVLVLFLGSFQICRRPPNPECHAQVLGELIDPVYLVGTSSYRQHGRHTMHCAGKCPNGTPCDTIVELRMLAPGTYEKRIRCGCEGQPVNRGCAVVLVQVWNHPDSVETSSLCNVSNHCPVEMDTCLVQEQEIIPDTIRSRLTGADSIISRKWLITCECMEEG